MYFDICRYEWLTQRRKKKDIMQALVFLCTQNTRRFNHQNNMLHA
jgi:hypothetical protein